MSDFLENRFSGSGLPWRDCLEFFLGDLIPIVTVEMKAFTSDLGLGQGFNVLGWKASNQLI
jgi:hypothetical protein